MVLVRHVRWCLAGCGRLMVDVCRFRTSVVEARGTEEGRYVGQRPPSGVEGHGRNGISSRMVVRCAVLVALAFRHLSAGAGRKG
jgi:hypothetical protein